MYLNQLTNPNIIFEVFAISGKRFFKTGSTTTFTMASAYKQASDPDYHWSTHYLEINELDAVEEVANMSGSEGHKTLEEALRYAENQAQQNVNTVVKIDL